MSSPASIDPKVSSKQEILRLLLKHEKLKSQTLAELLKVSPQAVRRHLNDLESEGLVTHTVETGGMGRPQYIYSLTKLGKKQFPEGYDRFAVNFLTTMVESVGREQVQRVLAEQWQKKAEYYRQRLGGGPLAQQIAQLAQLRQAEGYITEWYAKEQDFIYTEYNCAIASVAESFPVICGHELAMFSAIFQRPVERTHWLVGGEHHCGYLIKGDLDPNSDASSPIAV